MKLSEGYFPNLKMPFEYKEGVIIKTDRNMVSVLDNNLQELFDKAQN